MRAQVVLLLPGRASALTKKSPMLLCALKLLTSGIIAFIELSQIILALLRYVNRVLDYNYLLLSIIKLVNLFTLLTSKLRDQRPGVVKRAVPGSVKNGASMIGEKWQGRLAGPSGESSASLWRICGVPANADDLP